MYLVTEDSIKDTDQKSNQEDLPKEGKVLFLRDYCMRLKGVECERCVVACPHDAITINENDTPEIDPKQCSTCGICFGICDAFTSNKATLIDLNRRVARIAAQGETVYFTCQENIFPGLEPASSVIVLPCLACVPPELWALILTENIPVVIACDLSYCLDCERAGDIAEVLYTHAISTAEEWTGRKIKFSELIPEKENLVKDLTKPEGIERRNAFTNLIDDVADIASGKRRIRNSEVLQQFIERREKSRVITQLNISEIDELNQFAIGGKTRKILLPKRRMLLEALHRDGSIAQNIPLYLAEIQKELSPEDYVRDFTCPTGALSPDSEDGTPLLEINFCIGCGLCAEAYPEGDIEIIETTAEAFGIESDNPEELIDS